MAEVAFASSGRSGVAGSVRWLTLLGAAAAQLYITKCDSVLESTTPIAPWTQNYTAIATCTKKELLQYKRVVQRITLYDSSLLCTKNLSPVPQSTTPIPYCSTKNTLQYCLVLQSTAPT